MNQGKRPDQLEGYNKMSVWSWIGIAVMVMLMVIFSSCKAYDSRVRADMAQDIYFNDSIKLNKAGLQYLDSVTFNRKR